MNLSAFCHTEESFARLQDPYKALVADLALASEEMITMTPFESKQLIWKMMAKHKIEIPPELFNTMEKDDSLEMWTSFVDGSPGLMFLFAMGDILRTTSYTIEELSMTPWDQLFQRDPKYVEQIIGSFTQAVHSRQTQYDVTDWHRVSEIKSLRRRSMEVRVKQITPYRSVNGSHGVFGLIKSRPLST